MIIFLQAFVCILFFSLTFQTMREMYIEILKQFLQISAKFLLVFRTIMAIAGVFYVFSIQSY